MFAHLHAGRCPMARLGYLSFVSLLVRAAVRVPRTEGRTSMLALLGTCSLALGLGSSACSEDPPTSPPARRPEIQASVAAASDSACRVLDVTLDKSVAVVFPDRTTCGVGLTLIRGGTPSGSAKTTVAVIPLRLLNHGATAVQ